MRIRTQRHWVFLFIVCLFAGCATVSEPVRITYESSSDQTSYVTKRIPLNGIQMTEGLEGKSRFFVQVTGACTGKECAPEKYTMKFIREGMQSIQIEGRDVQLTVGKETITWRDTQARDVNRTRTIRSGVFAKIDLTREQLTTIASVQNVSGTVGRSSFSISYNGRAPLRKLVSKVQKKPKKSSEGDTSKEEASS